MKRKRKQVTLTKDRASEFFIGGITGCLQIAEKLKLNSTVGAGLMSAFHMALPDLSVKGIVRAYHNIGGDDLPPGIGAKLLAATAKKKPKRRR